MKIELENGMVFSDWLNEDGYYYRKEISGRHCKIEIHNNSSFYLTTLYMYDFYDFIAKTHGTTHNGSLQDKMEFIDKMLVKFYKLQVFS